MVIDVGGDSDTWIVWCKTAEEAVQRSRGAFGYNDDEPGDLRAVNADTTINEATRNTLQEIERVCTEAIKEATAALPSIAKTRRGIATRGARVDTKLANSKARSEGCPATMKLRKTFQFEAAHLLPTVPTAHKWVVA